MAGVFDSEEITCGRTCLTLLLVCKMEHLRAPPSRYAAELNPQEKALEFHLVLPGFCLMRPDGFDVDMDPVGSFPQMLQTRMQQVAMIRKALDMTKKAHAGQARSEVQGAE